MPQKKPLHRIPPMPPWFETSPWGNCRWCNLPILKENGEVNTRRRWHKECLHPYLIITDARYAKRQVKKRDKGVCCDCGTKCTYRWEWDMDHNVPLIEAPRELKYWSLDNLLTRCKLCHKKKTVAENAQRWKVAQSKRWKHRRKRV